VIQLDTSFLIRALVAGSRQDARLREWLRAGEPLAMSAIAWAEFLCGPATERQIELATAVVQERVRFAEEDAPLAARLFNGSGRRRGSMVDCLLAATALRAGAALATTNAADFERFAPAGLAIVS
jgi:predicted nucleic acid-binding protein